MIKPTFPSLAKFTDFVQLKDYRQPTKDEYVRYVRKLGEHYACDPATLTEDQLRAYFLFLRQQKKFGGSAMKLAIQPITGTKLVANLALGQIGHKALIHRLGHQLHFSRRSTFCPQAERKTVAVCKHHEFGALAAFGLSDQAPPFSAGTNVPSTKHSFKSNPPASLGAGPA